MLQATITSACCSQAGAGVILNASGNTKVKSRAFTSSKSSQSMRWFQKQRRLSFVPRAQPTEQSGETEEYFSYEGLKSVFPDEACEDTGEDCNAEGVFKETPYKAKPATAAQQAEGPDREYEDYAGKKTVFPGEACDDLGGEHCEPEYQDGVYSDKVGAAK